ncbi:MAG: hypothetical protein AB7T49_04680 [Oligoflexales bacterium]
MSVVNKDCLKKMLSLVGLRKSDGKLLIPAAKINEKPEEKIEISVDMQEWVQYEERLSDRTDWSYYS